MSLLQTPAPTKAVLRKRSELGHRIRVWMAALISIVFLTAVGVYGADYYWLPVTERPYSNKHFLLKPGGVIGLKLGILGTALFFVIFLYALRKVIPWLGRMGTARHWMDFHVIAGVSAPVVIAYHASFRFSGIAGIAFWIMLAVALSGIVGRYLYSQIPRSINAAELSMSEIQAVENQLTARLASQDLYSEEEIARVLSMPTPEHLRKIGALLALGEMIVLNLKLPFQVAALRRRAADFSGNVRSLWGLLASTNPAVEHVVCLVKEKASLSRRIIFLNHTQRVFHLWHVIHRPFSYTFAVLAIIHIAVVMGLGFMGWGGR